MSPLPFSEETGLDIHFQINKNLLINQSITLKIFNLNGDIVKTFTTRANYGSFNWKGGPGAQVYIYRLIVPGDEIISGFIVQIK